MRSAILLVAMLAGCIRADIVACGDGTACPSGTACDAIHGGCITPAQLTACEGLPATANCSAGDITGGCFDGICLPRGCGNRVIEAGEACDDGNDASGDGCRADCRSNETCGNGALDDGEQCDDGNLLSRDDCDSACLVEQIRWRLLPMSVNVNASTAYDPMRRRLVMVQDQSTWELASPQRYTFASTFSPAGFPLSYDSERQAVVAATAFGGAFAWNGLVWMQLAPPIPGTFGASTVGLLADPARHRVLALVSTSNPVATTIFALDASGAWSNEGVLVAGRMFGFAATAIDPENGDLVVRSGIQSSATTKEWIFDGSTWTMTDDPPRTPGRLFVLRGELRLFDDTRMFARRARTWVAIPSEDLPGFTSGIPFHDLDTDALVVQNGIQQLLLGSNGWTELPLPPTLATNLLTADDAFRLIERAADDTPNSIWRIDPDADPAFVLDPIATGPSGRTANAWIKAPGRRGSVAINGYPPCVSTCDSFVDSNLFDGTSWSTIENTNDVPNAYFGAYDPVGRRIVVETSVGNTFWQLLDDASVWTTAEPYTTSMTRMAWDGRNGCFVGQAGSLNARLFEYRESAWHEAELYPEGATHVTADERTGSILLITDAGSGSRFVWERRGSTWTKQESLPGYLNVTNTAYRSRDGALMLLGTIAGTGSLALFRDRTSPTPLETCEPGADVDGDGLAFCDDPDCYWRCSRCPPYTTCRFDLSP